MIETGRAEIGYAVLKYFCATEAALTTEVMELRLWRGSERLNFRNRR
jgi:hypothetical protein